MKAHEGQKAERIKKHVRAVTRRPEERCYYCHRNFGIEHQTKTRDHIIPTSRGGADVHINHTDCCRSCNGMKADYLPQELYDILQEYLATERKTYAPLAATYRSNMALQTICDSLLIVIKKYGLMKEQMLRPGLIDPLPRMKALRRTLVIDESDDYKRANQEAIEAIGREMELERENKKHIAMEKITPEKISIDYTLPNPKYGVGWTVYRPYKEGERYYIDKTIIHNRTVTDDVLVKQEQGEEWEMAQQPTRMIRYCVKGCTYPVFEEGLFKTEEEAKEWITKRYFEIEVKVA